MQRKINEACTAAAYVLFLAGSLFFRGTCIFVLRFVISGEWLVIEGFWATMADECLDATICSPA
jgi:hypothetical protein